MTNISAFYKQSISLNPKQDKGADYHHFIQDSQHTNTRAGDSKLISSKRCLRKKPQSLKSVNPTHTEVNRILQRHVNQERSGETLQRYKRKEEEKRKKKGIRFKKETTFIGS